MQKLKWLKPYLPEYLKLAVPAWVVLLLEVLVDLSLPTLLAAIVNTGIRQGDTAFIFRTGAWMLALALTGVVMSLSRNWLSTKVSQDLGTRLRGDLFRKVQKLSIAATSNFGTASLITRLTNDVMHVQNLSFMLTRIFIRAPLLVIGSAIMAFLLNPGLAAILLAIIPILAFLIALRIRRGLPLFQKVQNAIDRVNGIMREYLAGVRVVKVFNRFQVEQDKFDNANRNLTDTGVQAARSLASIHPLMLLVMNGSIILVLWLGGLRISSGNMQDGDILAFVNYFLQILQSMMMVSWIFTMGVRAKTSLDRIGEVFSLQETMVDADRPVSTQRLGTVEMRNAGFCWPGHTKPILSEISFKVNAGETIAIIGSTGCGKSSLINLIPRFFDASEGSVLVDGIDVRLFDRKELRQRIALVPQQSVLFTGSILDNLRWGKPDATREEIEKACEIACADEFIPKLSNGYDTWIGQGGVNLSGGQKQRLCIARALVRGCPILILDDSTSAIDMSTEARIRHRLREHTANLTVIIIAQRIHSVMSADRILVMDGGRIIGLGKHEDLLKDCQVYQDIYRSQMGLDPAGREVV
jgi:ATP-binding cassette subfamily B multidrug efflux pump